MTTWDLLLPTIVHRHDLACGLLEEIGRQWQPGLGVIVYRDNLQLRGNASYAKWQALEEMSSADYTSFISDDDWVAPDFVAKVMQALEGGPDCVGFRYRYTIDGKPGPQVVHSVRYGDWSDQGGKLTRPIGHYNPVRRELALLAKWRPVQDADRHWAATLAASGRVRDEAFIDEEMYHYRETGESWSRSGSILSAAPLPADQIRPLPDYPWLTVRDECACL